ncbi:MAG: hypothetical protein AB7F31_03235 [Parachlamydiales bacterium]
MQEQLVRKMMKGATRLPRSKNPFHYEQEQEKGTCATQGPMAFIRHRFLREAEYKLFKAHLDSKAISIHRRWANLEIQELLRTPFGKQEGELAI